MKIYLTNLGNEFQGIINLFWIMNSEYRSAFKSAYRKEDDQLWWHLLEQYQYCLQSLKIYIQLPDLSRRINSYIFNRKKRLKDLKEKQELNFPSLPDEHKDIIKWKENFENTNLNWKNSKDSLTAKLVSMFCESWQNLQALAPNDLKTDRKHKTRIRFALNKLSLLGITEISKYLADILCQSPGMVREPLQAVESLARQGCLSEVVEVLTYYQHTSYPMSEYMRAVTLRSLRFLPEMNVFIWEKIVEFATLGTLIERLMATETWIALGYISEQFVEPHHINAVLVALHGEPTPTPRLKKNYLLILGLHDSQLIKNEPINTQDYLLEEARNLVLEESVGDLFSYQEPQIIREKYYSGKGQSEIGDEVDYPIPR